MQVVRLRRDSRLSVWSYSSEKVTEDVEVVVTLQHGTKRKCILNSSASTILPLRMMPSRE